MSANYDHKEDKVLKPDGLPSSMRNLHFIMSNILTRAVQLMKELDQGVKKPFNEVFRGYTGDIQLNGSKPITYIRQLLALVTLPELLEDERFPADVKRHAERILKERPNRSIGCYSDYHGIEMIRMDVSKFISNRDGGIASDYNDIFLTAGATTAIKLVMKLLLREPHEKKAGFMIPIPQYPVFSLAITELNAERIHYYLDEDSNWGLNIEELDRAFNSAGDTCEPRAIVVINPGNPTGQVLSLENIKGIIKWAFKKRLFIIADEVYQDNIYTEELKFHSFKKVAHDLGHPYSQMESPHFIQPAKLVNIHPEVKVQFRKLLSTECCAPVNGQICLSAVVNPPKPGDESYDLFIKEKNKILGDFKERAHFLTEGFNKIDGVNCARVQGSMYAFPRVKIPDKAIQYAKSQNMHPDEFCCLELLENYGIAMAPGFIFSQKHETYHFRINVLAPIEKLKEVLSKFEKFNKEFLERWS